MHGYMVKRKECLTIYVIVRTVYLLQAATGPFNLKPPMIDVIKEAQLPHSVTSIITSSPPGRMLLPCCLYINMNNRYI
jgi:hypothetical protein